MKCTAMLLFSLGAAAQVFGPPQAGVNAPPKILSRIGIDPHPGAQVPLDGMFVDETGREVTLRRYTAKPVILALVYYQCPSLCNMVLNGIGRTAQEMTLTAGGDYELVAVSFDSRETARMAEAKKAAYAKRFPGARAWHFLTGPEQSSQRLASALGFHYMYDSLSNQFAHSAAIAILTPGGKISRYIYGITYPARDVRLALREASGGKAGPIVDQVLLYCYHYDPATGKYALVIMNVLRLAALATLGALAFYMALMFLRDRRQGRREVAG